jgi:hypothetical protein
MFLCCFAQMLGACTTTKCSDFENKSHDDCGDGSRGAGNNSNSSSLSFRVHIIGARDLNENMAELKNLRATV